MTGTSARLAWTAGPSHDPAEPRKSRDPVPDDPPAGGAPRTEPLVGILADAERNGQALVDRPALFPRHPRPPVRDLSPLRPRGEAGVRVMPPELVGCPPARAG